MSQKRYLSVSNFDTHLHYKDKNPIWIKLYCSILDDYEFAQISDETKFHAVGLMLLASRLNNKFPDDERWLRQKINANSKINLKLLLEIGFLEAVKGSRNRNKNELREVKDELTQTLATDKDSFNGCKPNKINDELSRAVLKDSENLSSLEQKRREEKRTEHNTTEQTHTLTHDAENGVAVCVDVENSKLKSRESRVESGESKVENQNSKDELRITTNELRNSQFSIEECLKYVEICQSKGEAIKSPKALANHLFKTGEADAFILATLYPEKALEKEIEIFGEPRKFSDEPCTICFGAKMADVNGNGFRKCPHCQDEKGKPKGFEPVNSEQ